MDIALILAGGLMLMFAGDALVRGSVALGLKVGMSPALIGLTVIAFGTSAPELFVSIEAAIKGSTDIALGNIVGSNISNTLLIVGLPALILALSTSSPELRRSYSMLLSATALFTAFALTGEIGRVFGIVLLAALVLLLIYSYRTSEGIGDDVSVESDAMPPLKMALFMIGGLVGLPVGAHLLIEGARGLALAFGLSEAAIGLTIVALGTSLPELAASTAAAFRGRSDVALGNVIGSNMMNLLAVLGATAVIAPLGVSRAFLTVDIPIMIAATLALAPFLIWRIRLGRRTGFLFLVVYAAFVYLALGDTTI